jgi:thiamine kinase-like enzyme
MKIVKVTYTAKAEYVEQNKKNIQTVMNDLRALNNSGINYNSCLGADGKSFTHTAFFQSEKDEQVLFALPSFKKFQEELKAGGIETPPKQELLNLVGSSVEIF